MGRTYPLVIVGSGPGGLAAAAQAAKIGLPYLLLERSGRFADTIHSFAKGKLVMDTPKRLPLHPDLPLAFSEGPVDAVLATWRDALEANGCFVDRLRLNSEVTRIAREGGLLRIHLADGAMVEALKVILALGTQGNITKLAVPGAEHVQYHLDDPASFADRRVVVIGSGDTAIENAIALSERNQVTIVVRGREFKPEKIAVANLAAIEKAIRIGTVKCRYNAETMRVEPGRIVLKVAGNEQAIECDDVIARIGSVKPRKFLEACGVRFDSDDENADPVINTNFETSVEGLYIVGALAGYPLIKHCLNQGFEAVEHIRNACVVPADIPVLKETFAPISGASSVEQVLRRIVGITPLFAGVSRLQLGDVLLDSKVVARAAGEAIILRDEYGDSLFVILGGTAAVEVHPDRPEEHRLLNPGDFFGEVGLISGRPRSATVRAATDSVLLEISRRAALKLFSAVPAARSQLDEALLVRQIRAYVSEDLAGDDLKELVDAARLIAYAFGDVIIAEGARDKDVYLIQSGSAKVTCRSWGRDVVLRWLPAGDLIGEYAHLHDKPRSATVTAATKTVVVKIDGAAFGKVLARNDALRQVLQQRMESQLRENLATMEEARTTPGVFNDFLAEGVGEATNMLVIDEKLCIRCDNCEHACAETHGGVSRLNREAGPSYATLHMPTSCRHCEQPHCMKDCPADALHRAPNGEVYIDKSCIGCGNCERSCPYNVIHMAAYPAPKPSLLSWLLFGAGSGPGEDKSCDGMAKRTGAKHAVKCDMCQGLDSGPACVSACPTGAAIRVNPQEFLAITQRVRA